ncbi:MAG: CsiV family protein [Pseudomonadota bacterium]
MSGRLVHIGILGALLLLMLAPALGQPRGGDAEDPRYYVEILVFQRDTASEPLYRFPDEPALDQALTLWPLVETSLFLNTETGLLQRSVVTPQTGYAPGRWQAQPPTAEQRQRPDPFTRSTVEPLTDEGAETLPANDPLDPQGQEPISDEAGSGGIGLELLPPPAPAALARSAPLLPVTDLFVAVPAESLIMVREWRALAAEPGLSPLTLRGWHQPAATFGDPQPVRLFGGALLDRQELDSAGMLLGAQAREPVFGVDGTVALERGRFLHLRIDLALHRKDRRGAPHYDDIKTLQQPGNYTTHRITQRRQVTLDAVNYFDHQFFGVVALVKQWPPEGAEPQENP